MSFNALLLLSLLVAAVSALTTPHIVRSPNHHALAARVAAIAPPEAPVASPLRKRASRKRCKPRPTAVAALSLSLSVSLGDHTPAPQPTSHKPDPATTHKVDPVTTPKANPVTIQKPNPVPSPTTKQAPPPAATPKPSGPSFLTGTQTGQGTFYATGLGACGITNTDTEHIAAVSHLLFDAYPGYDGTNPNHNPMCGRKVQATYQGKSVTVTLTDRCEGCAVSDLDFSPSAFGKLADFGLGRIPITWVWIE